MVDSTLDWTMLKRGGFIKQRQAEYFTVRLRVPAGVITTEQLSRVQDAANRFGRGYVHISTRQGLEIPWIKPESFEAIKSELGAVGIIPAGCGPRVRNFQGCPGSTTCSHGLVDARAMAEKLDALFFGQELPIKKFKVAVSGCPNSCTTPQVNDVGLVGMLEPELDDSLCTGCELCAEGCREQAITMADGLPKWHKEKCALCGDCLSTCPTDAWKAARTGYAIYLGGKVGRHPQLGTKIVEFASPDVVPAILEKIVDFIRDRGNVKERFGVMLGRVGLTDLMNYLNLEEMLGETACLTDQSLVN